MRVPVITMADAGLPSPSIAPLAAAGEVPAMLLSATSEKIANAALMAA
jgi:hypothetical protein